MRFICLLIGILLAIPSGPAWADQFDPSKTASQSNNQAVSLAGKWLALNDARRFVLLLVNKDRKLYGSQPVRLDATATLAAQRHADEMAFLSYGGHLDSRGRKADQRYTEAGGEQAVGENIALISRTNHSYASGQFSTQDLQEMQRNFMNEVAPQDGHRTQILNPFHNEIGIGLTSVIKNGIYSVYLTQEFVDNYGRFAPLPESIDSIQPITVSGSLNAGWKLDSIEICSEPRPVAIDKSQLRNQPNSYNRGQDFITQVYFALEPKKFKTCIENGRQRFSTQIMPDEMWKSGLYYLTILAKYKTMTESEVVSCRTFLFNKQEK